MSDAKETILNRIRGALKNVPGDEKPEAVRVPREYRRSGDLPPEQIVELFMERVGEYKATIKQVSESELTEAVAAVCDRHQARRIAVPADFPKEHIPTSIKPVWDDAKQPLSHSELDQTDGVLTTCALAVAQTGTIILDAGPGQGRRVMTLLPDLHICIVRKGQIVELIPEAFAHFELSLGKEGKPITFISGPSATSDIELSRVEGVHGPRRLEVLVTSS